MSTLHVQATFAAHQSPISALHWSPDSCYLLAVHLSTRLLQVFSLHSPSFQCRLDESTFGLTAGRFTPDSRHLLVSSAFALRLSLHSLVTASTCHIRRPKYSTAAHHFSPDGRLLAVAERHNGADHLGLYDTATWTQTHLFPLDPQGDLSDFTWAPDSLSLAAWHGVLEAAVDVCAVDGRRLMRWRGEEGGMGVARVVYSPCGLFLAVAGYDDELRLFHCHTAALVAQCRVEDRICAKGAAVYVERSADELQAAGEDAADKENEDLFPLSTLTTDLTLAASPPKRPAAAGHKHTASVAPGSRRRCEPRGGAASQLAEHLHSSCSRSASAASRSAQPPDWR